MLVTEQTHPLLWKVHDKLSMLERQFGLRVNTASVARFRVEAEMAVPHLDAEHKEAWAIYNAHQHPGLGTAPQSPSQAERPSEAAMQRMSLAIIGLLSVIAILLAIGVFRGH